MNRLTASLILTALLLIEAFLSRAITGSAMHQALLLAAVLVFFSVQWIGRRTSRMAGGLVAASVALGGWWMMKSGAAPVVLSELPPAFHLAMGVHFWAWSRFCGGGRENLGAKGCLAVLAAAAGIVWTLGQVEIYGSSILGVRIQAVTVLAASLVLAWAWGGEIFGGRPANSVEGKIWHGGNRPRPVSRFLMLTVLLIGVVVSAASSMRLSDKAALLSFEWLSRDQSVTELGDFGQSDLVFSNSGGLGDGATRQLPKRADIRMNDSVRFHLLIKEPREFAAAIRRPLYLCTSAMAFFSSDGRMGPRRQGAWIYDSDDGTEDGITVIENATNAADSFDYWALIDRKDAMGLPLMPGTESVGVSGVYAFADDWYQLALEESQEKVRYLARAAPVRWRDLLGEGDIEKGDAPIDYLQLPSGELTDHLLRDALAVAPREASLAVRLAGIERLVESRCQYSLQFDNPDDLEPVENFFYGERRGHCELFAVGTAMLLRGIGVPARVAFGYSGGVSTSERRLFAFRESDYHAWAEIFLKNHGWVVFDTTPTGLGAAVVARENPGSPAFSAIDFKGYEDLGSERLLGQIEVSFFPRLIAGVIDWVARWFLALCLVAAVVALAIYGWRNRRRNRSGSSSGKTAGSGNKVDAKRVTPGLLNEYLTACAELGHLKAPSQTLNEFLISLNHDGICSDELDELTAYLYRVQYAEAPPDSDLESRFRREIDATLVSPTREETAPV